MGKHKIIPVMCLAVGVILAGIAALTTDVREDITSLDRPSAGNGREEYDVTVLYDGTESNIKIPVEERQLEFAEAKELLDEAFDEIMMIMDRENNDLSNVTTDVLFYILLALYEAMPYLFSDLKLSSFFSGIGAFEIALDRLYEDVIAKEQM